MAAPLGQSTTLGDTMLPDVGSVAYNGVTFSSFVHTKVSGNALPDEAGRTVKFVEWTFDFECVATLNKNASKLDGQAVTLRQRLDQQGGVFTFTGRGLGGFSVNTPGGTLFDAAWGPKPKTLFFQPLGGGNSAMVRWQLVTTIPELQPPATRPVNPPPFPTGPIVQFNEETTTSYDERGYCTLDVSGTMEVPLTRRANGTPGSDSNRTLSQTVDDYREKWMDRVADSFDLTRYKITSRRFHHSRDKRTMEWSFSATQIPPMGLPMYCTKATGNASVRPLRQGPGLVQWACTLRATYTVRPDQPHRVAWWAFLSLLQWRMRLSQNGVVAPLSDPSAGAQQFPEPPGGEVAKNQPPGFIDVGGISEALASAARTFGRIYQATIGDATQRIYRAMLVHFGYDEGLYEGSDQTTFEATWRLVTEFPHVLRASGIWQWPPAGIGGDNWAISVRDILGWKGVYRGLLNPDGDAIVDMGGGMTAGSMEFWRDEPTPDGLQGGSLDSDTGPDPVNTSGGGTIKGGGPPPAAAAARFSAAASGSDAPPGTRLQPGVKLPWVIDPLVSWLEFSCWIEVSLDAGVALHKILPQGTGETGRPLTTGGGGSINPYPKPSFDPSAPSGGLAGGPAVDTLATVAIDDPSYDLNATGGVNTVSAGGYKDFVQRMATSTYTFRLRGYGLRAGYQIPIPGLVSVAGVTAYPTENQHAYNMVASNWSGIPVFFARWDLEYTVSKPPTDQLTPPPNVAGHVRGDVELPDSIQAVYTDPDANSVSRQLIKTEPPNGP
jgi:hypothetical protein